MRIIGIDPGFAIIGFGIIEYENSRYKTIDYGAITTPAGEDMNVRLGIIYKDLCDVLDTYKPDVLAVEKLFFNSNQKTVINVAQARGIILLAAVQRGIKIYEYTPLEVKKSITGYGRAVKKQVQEMTRRILSLQKIPKPDDTADALAMAICHAHASSSQLHQYTAK